jgi:hypothetical protein
MTATTTPATLWRISIATEEPITKPDALATGLRRHLAVAPLRAAIVQIGDRQQAYITLEGCPGCAYGRCVEGCRVESLRRTLRAAAGPNIAITLVRSGLTQRPYTRRYALRLLPGFTGVAPALAGTMLHHWPDARLMVAWEGIVKEQPTFTAWLHLGNKGPEPQATFAEFGWQTILRRLLPGEHPSVHLANEFGMLTPINGPLPWVGDPWLPVPAIDRAVRAVRQVGEGDARVIAANLVEARRPLIAAGAAPEGGEAAQEGGEVAQEGGEAAQAARARRARLADHLPPIVAGENIFAKRGELASVALLAAPTAPIAGLSNAPTAPAKPKPESIWPKGPGSGKGALWPNVLDTFFATILAPDSPYYTADQLGLTYRRVLDTLGERHAEHARALIVWLDQAGLLAEPANPTRPWECPRPLTTPIPTEIAAGLQGTPHPTGEALERAKQEGLKS